VRLPDRVGPATVADVSAWFGVDRLRDVVERLRPRLRTFRDERGGAFLRARWSVAESRYPAPPRFLPEFDNLLIGHDDRTRVIHRISVLDLHGNIAVDGFIQGTWTIKRSPDGGDAAIEPVENDI